MSHLTLLPPVAYALAIVVVLLTVATGGQGRKGLWRLPAVAAVFFLIYSLVTVFADGIMPFWFNHTANLAGNQVWFDLLFAVSIGFFALAPRAKAVGMPLLPWAIATLALACVALLPMLARLLWLEERRAA